MPERLCLIYSPLPVTIMKYQRFGSGWLLFFEAGEVDRVAYFDKTLALRWDQQADEEDDALHV